MAGFSDILKQGKRRFKVKNGRGKYGKCEYCDTRQKLFQYYDGKKELWLLCNSCANIFIEEEE